MDQIRVVNEVRALGFVMIPIPVMMDRKLNSEQKMLYSVLLRFESGKGYCWPSVDRISKTLGLGERATQVNMAVLVERGLVIRKQKPGKASYYWIVNIEHVYGTGTDHQFLSDDTINDLTAAGEDSLVDHVTSSRSDYIEQFGGVINEKSKKTVEVSRPKSSNGIPFEDSISESCTGVVKTKNKDKPKFEESMRNADSNRIKSENATDRRKQRAYDRSKLPPVEKPRKIVDIPLLSMKELENEWILAMRSKWPDTPCAPWSGKYFGIAKTLVERFEKGGLKREDIFDAICQVPRIWDDLVNRYNLHGYPTIQVVAGFADTWIPEIITGNIDGAGGRDKSRKTRQYNDDLASQEEKEGGITFL